MKEGHRLDGDDYTGVRLFHQPLVALDVEEHQRRLVARSNVHWIKSTIFGKASLVRCWGAYRREQENSTSSTMSATPSTSSLKSLSKSVFGATGCWILRKSRDLSTVAVAPGMTKSAAAEKTVRAHQPIASWAHLSGQTLSRAAPHKSGRGRSVAALASIDALRRRYGRRLWLAWHRPKSADWP